MTEKLLFEIKIVNPNRSSNPLFPLFILFTLVLLMSSLLTANVIFIAFSTIFFFLSLLIAAIYNRTPRDASFQLIHLEEQKHLIKLLGGSLDFKLEGELSYELWRKPTQSHNSSRTYNVSNLSIFAPDKTQILIKSGNYSSHNNWGILRGASPYPIGIILEMNKSEIEAIKTALEEHKIKLLNITF
jgi:hypothetical protein